MTVIHSKAALVTPKFNFDQLRELVSDKNHEDTFTSKYAGWNKLDPQDENKLLKLDSWSRALHRRSQSIKTIGIRNPKYQQKDTPMMVVGYMNIRDIIPTFFVYTEFSGHVPEKRCRYINKKLFEQ